ncbi:hypothetical protein GOC74_00270 [Halomicrobium mukohataei]|uniref:O-antigen ligase-related domain-containing protein n=1 Tax=Halomicrobium mukohataei TaxID=57705 RepID=A0A847TYJ5_9EURY|nr:O-antigen ligase family protein [Halomicrobium mukohataei]NLV08373.1 hypothetical protein [Halomicrobium mukohataei]
MQRNQSTRSSFTVGHPGDDWIGVLLGVYLFGLVINTHPALNLWIGGIEVFRPDRVLVIPFVGYYLLCNVELRITEPVLFGIAFFATMALSAVTNGVASGTFLSLSIQYVYVLGVFILMTSLQLSTDQLRGLLRFLVLMFALIALIGVVQAVTLNVPFLGPDAIPFRFSTYYGYRRPYSLTAEPSYLAMLLSSGVAVLFPAVVSNRPILFSQRNQRYLLWLLTVGVVVSGSMSGYLTLVGFLSVAVPVVLWIYGTNRTIVGKGLSGILGALLVISVDTSFIRMLASRLSGLIVLLTELGGVSGSADIRLFRWLTAVEVWRENPLLGVAPGGYEQYVIAHRPTTYLNPQRLVSVEGGWLPVLAMTGAVGFILFVAIWGSILRQAVAVVSDSARVYSSDLCLIGLSVVLVQLIGWTFTFSFVDPFRWAMIAVGYLLVLHAAAQSSENCDGTTSPPSD